MRYVIAQILGVIVSLICLVNPQMKKRWQMLTGTILANLLSAIHFLLLGQPSAVGVCAVAVVQSLVGVAFVRAFTKPHLYWSVPLFTAGYVFGGLLPYLTEGTLDTFTWLSALPIIGALMLMGGVMMKKEQHMRLFSVANILIFITYDILIMSTQIFAQIIGLVSVLIALWRYRKMKKETAAAPAASGENASSDPAEQ